MGHDMEKVIIMSICNGLLLSILFFSCSLYRPIYKYVLLHNLGLVKVEKLNNTLQEE